MINIEELALRIIANYDDLGIELEPDRDNPDIDMLAANIHNDAMNSDDELADDLNLLDADQTESLLLELANQLALRIYA